MSSRPRLFIALNLSRDVRDDIWHATEELRGHGFPVRWVRPELLHVTIKFLGEVNSDFVTTFEKQIGEAAAEARQHSIPIEGMGAFPSLRRPQAVWAACEPVPAMELLQHGVETRFTKLGFATDGRPFRPHVTVGRLKRGVDRQLLEDFGREFGRIQLSSVALVSSVELMESKLSATAPSYNVVRSFEFGS